MSRILLCLAAALLGLLPLTHSHAAPANPPTGDPLLRQDVMTQQVDAASLAKYREIVGTFAVATRARPDDSALALARCKFMQNYSWSDELRWVEQAQTDLSACQQNLKARFGDVPEVALYLLQSVYGKAAVEQGSALLPKAVHWPPQDRARLHAALANAYEATRDTRNAGLQAVEAAELAPDTPVLLLAVRHLATNGEKTEAIRLLMNAPVPGTPWVANARINTAHDVLPGTTARDVLLRMQKAGLKIDPFTSARALFQAGDVTGAQRVLPEINAKTVESPQNRAFRLTVALAAGDTKAALAAIQAPLEHDTGNRWTLAQTYAVILKTDPMAALKPVYGGLLLALVSFGMCLVLMPGLLMFPAHYVGTVRVRRGRPIAAVFDGIGLRHAWYALMVFGVVTWIVPTVMLEPSTSHPAAMQTSQFARAHFVTLFVTALALAWTVRRFGWRQWIGTGQWKAKWFIWPVCLVLIIALSGWFATHHLPKGTEDTLWAEKVTLGAAQLGGPGLALLLLAVAVPIVEEFVFRGCLLGGLTRHMSFVASNLWQAALFAAAHFDAKRFLYFFLIGLTAGWLAKKTRGLAASIALHAAINAIFVTLILTR